MNPRSDRVYAERVYPSEPRSSFVCRSNRLPAGLVIISEHETHAKAPSCQPYVQAPARVGAVRSRGQGTALQCVRAPHAPAHAKRIQQWVSSARSLSAVLSGFLKVLRTCSKDLLPPCRGALQHAVGRVHSSATRPSRGARQRALGEVACVPIRALRYRSLAARRQADGH